MVQKKFYCGVVFIFAIPFMWKDVKPTEKLKEQHKEYYYSILCLDSFASFQPHFLFVYLNTHTNTYGTPVCLSPYS